MSYQNEWLLFEVEDEFDEIEHREPTEEFLFYRAVASGDIDAVKKNCGNYTSFIILTNICRISALFEIQPALSICSI